MPIDYPDSERLLEEEFRFVENALLTGQGIVPPQDELVPLFETLFTSKTQAFREVLVGCVLARLQDRNIDATLPYVGHGDNAYNGRSLDERVVNPFFRSHRIPASTGPFLNMFRRSVRFNEETAKGVRDKKDYAALLSLIGFLNAAEDEATLRQFLQYLLLRFAQLREAGTVRLSRLQRISLSQYDAFLTGLLATPSGGRVPLMLAVSMCQAIRQHFDLQWTIEFQGINVADAAVGAGGDITISEKGKVLLAVEVTERPVNRNRVITTFNTKIAPNEIHDYLFVTTSLEPDPQAKAQADHYFAQGAEVNFIEIKSWIMMVLATMGAAGREVFNWALTGAFDAADTPVTLKVAWNDQVERLTTIH